MIAANLRDPNNPLLGVGGTTLTPTFRSGAATFPRDINYDPNINLPRMWRLSLASGLNAPLQPPQPPPPRAPNPPPLPLSKLLADSVFIFDDDLNYDRAADASLVAAQVIEDLPAVANAPARRQVEGRLSWMATLTPKLDRYTGPDFNVRPLIGTYVLSVVVFYDRPASLVYNADPLNERVLNVAAMPGGGVTGGEVLLTGATEADLDIHTNEWIMLMGTLPAVRIGINPLPPNNQVFTDPVHVFKWYRVSDTEAEVTFNGTSYERYVTLMGQDWPTNTIINTTPQLVAQAVVMEGVVAVMEKTIRLEP